MITENRPQPNQWNFSFRTPTHSPLFGQVMVDQIGQVHFAIANERVVLRTSMNLQELEDFISLLKEAGELSSRRLAELQP